MKTFIIILFALHSITSLACENDEVNIEELISKGLILKGPLEINAVERESLIEIKKVNKKETLPFGRIHTEWLKLKSSVEKGGQLYFISSPKELWEKPLSGAYEGYIVIKRKCAIEFLRTKVS